MSKTPSFRLTRRAAIDLREINKHSRRTWGQKTADGYISDLYAAMRKAAADPDSGLLRHHRTAPFLVVPARKHFVVYNRIPGGIVVLTILHQVRDLEALVGSLTPAFLEEIEKLRPATSGKASKAKKRKL